MTFKQNAERGHDHPDSTAARRERIAASEAKSKAKIKRFNSMLIDLSQLVRNEDDVVQVLHAVARGLNSSTYVNIDIQELIEEIDLLADQIEYRDAS